MDGRAMNSICVRKRLLCDATCGIRRADRSGRLCGQTHGSAIANLLATRRPPEIADLVVALVVDAIERQAVRTATDRSYEQGGSFRVVIRQPVLDASTAITLVRPMMPIHASSAGIPHC